MKHIIPNYDSKLHEKSIYCECRPIIKEGVAVHNAFDGRDAVEKAKEVLNETNIAV